MKYLCKSCKTKCNDIMEHMRNVHKFTDGIIKSQLKTNPNTFKEFNIPIENKSISRVRSQYSPHSPVYYVNFHDVFKLKAKDDGTVGREKLDRHS